MRDGGEIVLERLTRAPSLPSWIVSPTLPLITSAVRSFPFLNFGEDFFPKKSWALLCRWQPRTGPFFSEVARASIRLLVSSPGMVFFDRQEGQCERSFRFHSGESAPVFSFHFPQRGAVSLFRGALWWDKAADFSFSSCMVLDVPPFVSPRRGANVEDPPFKRTDQVALHFLYDIAFVAFLFPSGGEHSGGSVSRTAALFFLWGSGTGGTVFTADACFWTRWPWQVFSDTFRRSFANRRLLFRLGEEFRSLCGRASFFFPPKLTRHRRFPPGDDPAS